MKDFNGQPQQSSLDDCVFFIYLFFTGLSMWAHSGVGMHFTLLEQVLNVLNIKMQINKIKHLLNNWWVSSLSKTTLGMRSCLNDSFILNYCAGCTVLGYIIFFISNVRLLEGGVVSSSSCGWMPTSVKLKLMKPETRMPSAWEYHSWNVTMDHYSLNMQ